jgi:SAM-dependent methyltransferase
MTADHAERVAEIYSGHARGYADFWSAIIRPAACRLLDALPWTDARRVLDIGTGTGALVPDIHRHAPSAVVIGVDRSPGMLALASEAGTPVALMDASNLALRDQAMDIAVMAFVLFNVQEPVAALTEAARVLRPGGTLGTSTWAADPMTRAAQVWDDELNAHGAIDRLPMPWENDDLMNTPAKMAALFSKSWTDNRPRLGRAARSFLGSGRLHRSPHDVWKLEAEARFSGACDTPRLSRTGPRSSERAEPRGFHLPRCRSLRGRPPFGVSRFRLDLAGDRRPRFLRR